MACSPDIMRLAIGINNTSHMTAAQLWMKLSIQNCDWCSQPGPYLDVLVFKRCCVDTSWFYGLGSSARYTPLLPEDCRYPHISCQCNLPPPPFQWSCPFCVDGEIDCIWETELQYEKVARRKLRCLLRKISRMTPTLLRPQRMSFLNDAVPKSGAGYERRFFAVVAPWPAQAQVQEQTATQMRLTTIPDYRWESGFICKTCCICSVKWPRWWPILTCLYESFDALVEHNKKHHGSTRPPMADLFPRRKKL